MSERSRRREFANLITMVSAIQARVAVGMTQLKPTILGLTPFWTPTSDAVSYGENSRAEERRMIETTATLVGSGRSSVWRSYDLQNFATPPQWVFKRRSSA